MHEKNTRPARRARWTAGLGLALAAAGAVGTAALLGGGTAQATPAPARATATVKVVVRPVTGAGHAAKGYRVVTDRRPAIECWEASRVAVSAGIAHCGSSADNTLACWPSAAPAHVLCLTDPFTRTLRSIRLSGGFPAVSAPRHPTPQALLLPAGHRYLARSGGAWSIVAQHPTWAGFYYERTTFDHDVYGPASGDGINRSHPRWVVTTYLHDAGHGVRHAVKRAYFVGTAR